MGLRSGVRSVLDRISGRVRRSGRREAPSYLPSVSSYNLRRGIDTLGGQLSKVGGTRRGRVGGLRRRCLPHLTGCRSRLRGLKSHGSFDGASRSTAFVHVGRSRVGGKRLGPTCGVRVTARGRFVAGLKVCEQTKSAKALVSFLGSFQRACRERSSVMITSTNCKDRRGCRFVRGTNVRTFIGCGCFRGRRGHT